MNPQLPPTPSITFPQPNKKLKLAVAVLAVLFIATLTFAIWAFTSRSSIKKDADNKLAAANQKLTQAQSDEASATAAIKTPYKSFTGPATYGSVSFNYPKSWDAYIDQTGNTEPIDGYFYPGAVPGIQSPTAFALRVELVSNDYSSILDQFQGDINDGSVQASAYIPPKMKGVANASVGTMLSGTINQDSSGNPQTGTMVILKVRDQTLQVYSESPNYLKDFNSVVLSSLTYKP